MEYTFEDVVSSLCVPPVGRLTPTPGRPKLRLGPPFYVLCSVFPSSAPLSVAPRSPPPYTLLLITTLPLTLVPPFVHSEPLSQVTDVEFQEAHNASCFGQLLLAAQATDEHEHDFPFKPSCSFFSVGADASAAATSTVAGDALSPAAATTAATATTAAAAGATPTQAQLPFKKRKSSDGGGEDLCSGRGAKKQALSPATPSVAGNALRRGKPTSRNAPISDDEAAAAFVMSSISERVKERCVCHPSRAPATKAQLSISPLHDEKKKLTS